jgi:hypothetical protein
MKPIKVREAIDEARRFIERAEALMAEATRPPAGFDPVETYFPSTSGRQSGACKRASLDLTVVLAAMRKA